MATGRTWILAVVLSFTSALGFTSVAAGPPSKVVPVVIDKATFANVPGVLVGDTVEWINKDVVNHTATSKLGGWDVVVPAGQKARVVMTKAGTFEYICLYHPNMVGKIVVKGS